MTDQSMIEKVARAMQADAGKPADELFWTTAGTSAGIWRQLATAAIKAMREEAGWQPIETAPRDGTHFLATAIVRNVKTGARWWETYVIWADDETGEIHPDCDHGWSNIDDYSHWMPLPAPPIDAALKGEEG
ncbi:hypothetical protein [Sphingobium sp. WCS2017Hpa-17]|uniref:hypothetical protein n=1 Tax=Sphingobium sp. WCS2017Hpa-17 TaxID=3073638 RepID=UPI00288BD216|nr:hypothetical protein [Sphingobium sp. WCS2017Hpa-17]